MIEMLVGTEVGLGGFRRLFFSLLFLLLKKKKAKWFAVGLFVTVLFLDNSYTYFAENS